MYREYVKDCQERKAVVKVHLVNGGCVEGRIDRIGLEAIVLTGGNGVRQLIMKPGIVTISPGGTTRKEG